MSTKIYDGLISAAPLTLEAICAFQREMSRFCSKRAEKLITDYLIDAAISFHDRVKCGFPVSENDREKSPVNLAYSWLMEGRKDLRARIRQPSIDYSFEITVIPTEDGQHTLVLPFCERIEWVTKLTEKLNLSEYGYWDNSDRPEEVSAKEWNARKQAWKKALNNFDSSPAESGMSIQLCKSKYNEWWVPETEALIAQILAVANSQKGRKQRASNLAKELDQNTYFKLHASDNDFMLVFMQNLRKWREDIQTKGGAKRLAALTHAILVELPLLTEQDLTQQFLSASYSSITLLAEQTRVSEIAESTRDGTSDEATS